MHKTQLLLCCVEQFSHPLMFYIGQCVPCLVLCRKVNISYRLSRKKQHRRLLYEEETAVQAEVTSIVFNFRRLKKPGSREMSACGYALHSVYPQLSFFPFTTAELRHNDISGR